MQMTKWSGSFAAWCFNCVWQPPRRRTTAELKRNVSNASYFARAPQVQPGGGGWFQDHKGFPNLVELRPLVISTHFSARRRPSLRADFNLVMTRNGAKAHGQLQLSSIWRARIQRLCGGTCILRTEGGYINVRYPCQTSCYRSLTVVCICIRVGRHGYTDWRQQRRNEFPWSMGVLQTLLRSFSSCASLSPSFVRARARVRWRCSRRRDACVLSTGR
jgi:hypothetical protein